MSGKPDSAHDLAELATDNFLQMEALFKAIIDAAEDHSTAKRLASLGRYYAADWGNYFDCQREEIELQEKEARS